MFTDTHCHLAAPELAFRLPEIVAQAANVGVTQFIAPAITPHDWQTLIAWQKLPEIRAVALGIHPWFCEQYSPEIHDLLAQCLRENPLAWVGEIGLDFHHNQDREKQAFVFEKQLKLAKQHSRPIIAHNVKSYATFLQIVQREKFECGGIAHAFSGSLEQAKMLIKHGFKIGIGTLLLNPNAKKTRAAAQNLPLEHLLIETDSPFLRGGTDGSPELLAQIAQELADLRGMDLGDLAAVLENNLREILIC